LFYYRDSDGDHYLIETAGGRISELTNEERTVHIEGKGDMSVNSNKYIGPLKATLADCPQVRSEIDKSELTHKSLIKIVKDYHGYVCNGEKCIVYEKKLPILY
jgi:hypothetical protein